MKRSFLLFGLACCSICLVANVNGATIKTLGGETIQGEIQGTLLLKSHVWQLKTESGQYGIVYYLILSGSAVKSVDEKNVELEPRAQFQAILVDWDATKTAQAPTEAEILKISGEKNKQMPVDFHFFENGSQAMFVKLGLKGEKGDVNSVFRDFPSSMSGTSNALLAAPTLDRIVGESQKDAQGAIQIIPGLRIMSGAGERSVKAEEIYSDNVSKS